MFEVTLWGVLAAGVANVILGFIWYHPKVFGRPWMAMAGVTPEMMERGKRKMPLMAFLGLVSGIVMAYILNHFGIAWGVIDALGAAELAFWTWLGFVATVLLGSVLWEQKPFKYYLINAGYWLLALIVMAEIILWLST